jgi:hypothetical protein
MACTDSLIYTQLMILFSVDEKEKSMIQHIWAFFIPIKFNIIYIQ